MDTWSSSVFGCKGGWFFAPLCDLDAVVSCACVCVASALTLVLLRCRATLPRPLWVFRSLWWGEKVVWASWEPVIVFWPFLVARPLASGFSSLPCADPWDLAAAHCRSRTSPPEGPLPGTWSPAGSPAPALPAGFSWVFPPRLHPGLLVSTQLAGASGIFTLFPFLWGCCTLQPDVKCMKILVLFNLYGVLVLGKGRLNLVSFNYDQSRDLLPLYFMNIFMIRNFRCLFVFPLAVWTCRSEPRACLPFRSFVCNGFPLS